MSRNGLVVVLLSLWVVSLAFHFIVEGLGGVQDHAVGREPHASFHSHEGDQFVLGQPADRAPRQPEAWFQYRCRLRIESQPLAPLLPPPISI